MSADADATRSAARVVDTTTATARAEFTAVTDYTRTSHDHGTDRFVIVLFGIWVLGFALLSLVVGIPLAVLSLMTNASASTGEIGRAHV